MSETKLDGTKTPQDRDALRDDELNAVSGGGGFSAVDVQSAPMTASPSMLEDIELDAVTGGKLYEALSKGTHIPNVVIEFC